MNEDSCTPPFLCCSGIWLNLKAVFGDEVLGSVLWKALLSATAALFPPRPSLSFAFQLSVWGSQTDPSKPSLFPWSICPSLPPSAFLFLEGAPSCLCVQMTCVITSTPVNEFTPLQLSRDVQQHRLVSTVTRGYLGSSLPLPMPRGPARSGETRHFNACGRRPQKSALLERPHRPLEETEEHCRQTVFTSGHVWWITIETLYSP